MKELKEWIKSIIIAVLLALIIRSFIMESFIVDGSSMQPTLANQQRVLVNKISYRFKTPKRGEIIVFPLPNDENRILIKRVIGLPGDKVEIIDGRLFLNDQEVHEDYILFKSDNGFGPVVVPDDKVFVLGDNRSNSIDSRNSQVGFIDIGKIRGKAFLRYWPLSEFTYFN
ncbi:signal peptidase I [Anaerobranca californiensis DSM 14826]|jgi:signal peptidase I|uniref:Signal peptidase I n=1 Tax=Anaerobranca californiensis DSM 14826 TaxID=1120989 RepID=A0A1M6KM12_9FIRM|nr:signal peptidase I [Anaerobranca californiensis]SHJ59971.1 signal peptidase I [Anaerobranca californiensis DSM 14826]